MSVMLIDPKSFKKNVDALNRFSWLYLYGKTLYFDEIEPIMDTLQEMNVRSYNERYNENAEVIPYREVYTSERHNNLLELLKSLQCLRYNIELDEKKFTFNKYRAWKFLNDQIEAIKSYIISELPEYKNAQWA